MQIELYPDVTSDFATWPVLYRAIDLDTGHPITAYDPMPWDRKQLQRAQLALDEAARSAG